MANEVWPTTDKVVVKREPITTPPAPHKVTIYASDGSAIEVFPIDAKEAVAGGEYSYQPPVLAEPALAEPAVQENTLPMELSEAKPARRGRSRASKE